MLLLIVFSHRDLVRIKWMIVYATFLAHHLTPHIKQFIQVSHFSTVIRELYKCTPWMVQDETIQVLELEVRSWV